MTNAEIFDRATATFGGRLPRHLVQEHVRRAYQEIEDRAQDLISAVRRDLPELPDVHFDFIFNRRINALAFKESERYFVGFNTGTVFMLRHVIGRMLSDARLFEDVGNPAVERSDLGRLERYAPNAEVLLKQEPISTPNDPVRVTFAEFLQDQAIMFLVGHELVHIVHGHVDYLHAKRQRKITTELGAFEGSTSEEERFERQALEQDADRRSIISRIDSLRLTLENGAVVPWRPQTKHAVELLSDWALSVNILFRLFGDVRLNHTQFAESPYPPLQLRRLMCDAAAFWSVGNIFGDQWTSAAMEGLKKAQYEADIAFSTMLGEDPSTVGVDIEWMRRGMEHATRLEQYWHDHLVKVLQRHAYEQLK